MRSGELMINAIDDDLIKVTNCLRGMVCNEGTILQGGTGECPSGYFCPHTEHSGVLCPPRHYCPGRGNTAPIKCNKGTYNMYFG
jgi:hypothetical protein